MSTVFISVRCCQCSIMQVKQKKKKSSKKWSCVVCNEKQSVRKVFAQGFMAKDVRKYVQTFNISRLFADQQQTLDAPPEPEEIIDAFQFMNQKKKRTDWSEYLDYENDVEIEDDSEDVFERKIVTELLKALFKKPKLSNLVGDLDTEDGEKPITPVSGKRNADTDGKETSTSRGGALRKDAFDWSDCKRKAVQNFGNKEPLKSQPSTARAASKWIDYMIPAKEDEEDNFTNKATWKNESSMVKGASRWNEFITDEDDFVLERGREFGDRMGQWNQSAAFETTIDAQLVEDDIHPDFL